MLAPWFLVYQIPRCPLWPMPQGGPKVLRPNRERRQRGLTMPEMAQRRFRKMRIQTNWNSIEGPGIRLWTVLLCTFLTQPLPHTQRLLGSSPLSPEALPALLGLPLTNSGFCVHLGDFFQIQRPPCRLQI